MIDRDLIYVNVMPYNTESTKSTFLNFAEEGKNLGCIVGSESDTAVYFDDVFEKMLTVFDSQKKNGESVVITASQEIYRIKDYNKQNEIKDQEYETKISSLQARIDDINEQINQKQNEYYNLNS